MVSECLYLLGKCSLILLSPFALTQLEEITPLMGMLFMCFFTMFRVWGSDFQPGGCLPVFCGLRDELLINIFIILYFVFRTWNHFLPYPKQWDYLAVTQSLILFGRG